MDTGMLTTMNIQTPRTTCINTSVRVRGLYKVIYQVIKIFSGYGLLVLEDFSDHAVGFSRASHVGAS